MWHLQCAPPWSERRAVEHLPAQSLPQRRDLGELFANASDNLLVLEHLAVFVAAAQVLRVLLHRVAVVHGRYLKAAPPNNGCVRRRARRERAAKKRCGATASRSVVQTACETDHVEDARFVPPYKLS